MRFESCMDDAGGRGWRTSAYMLCDPFTHMQVSGWPAEKGRAVGELGERERLTSRKEGRVVVNGLCADVDTFA